MAKLDRNTIQNALNEANELEYELSFDEQCRQLDEFEHPDDWRSELEPEHEPLDDWYFQDDHFDNSHWPDPSYYDDDLFDGDY